MHCGVVRCSPVLVTPNRGGHRLRPQQLSVQLVRNDYTWAVPGSLEAPPPVPEHLAHARLPEPVSASPVIPTHAPASPATTGRGLVVPSSQLTLPPSPRLDVPSLAEQAANDATRLANQQFHLGVAELHSRQRALTGCPQPDGLPAVAQPASHTPSTQPAHETPGAHQPHLTRHEHNNVGSLYGALGHAAMVTATGAHALLQQQRSLHSPAITANEGQAGGHPFALHQLTHAATHGAAMASWAVTAALHHTGELLHHTGDRLAQKLAEGAAMLQQASLALQQEQLAGHVLREQVAALKAESASLAAQVEELQRRAESAESRCATLQMRADNSRAQSAVDEAVQLFSRHAAGVPPSVDPRMFYETEAALIGKGGCGRVYSWHAGDADWAVKVDQLQYRYSRGVFEPERCADLLPSLLPPHPCVAAPAAWWVAPIPPAQAPSSAATQPGHALASGPTRHSGAALRDSGGSKGQSFKLFTLQTRYTCTLREHVDSRAVAATAAASAGSSAVALVRKEGAQPARDGSPRAPGQQRTLLSPVEQLCVVRDVASALEHLAQHGVIHCDVKPENIMLWNPSTIKNNAHSTISSSSSSAAPKHCSASSRAGAPSQAAHQKGSAEFLPGAACNPRAVLIDFGLARLVTSPTMRVEARGGTWLFKAPEQLQGPGCGLFCSMDGVVDPYVCQATDVWALGAVICWMAHDGELHTAKGLPLSLQPDEVAKWGDRPSAQGGVEPFYMAYADVLPPEPEADIPSEIMADAMSGARDRQRFRSSSRAGQDINSHAVQQVKLRKLLRDLAVRCLDKRPGSRPTARQIREEVTAALNMCGH